MEPDQVMLAKENILQNIQTRNWKTQPENTSRAPQG